MLPHLATLATVADSNSTLITVLIVVGIIVGLIFILKR